MADKQKTLLKEVTLSGAGLHTGQNVTVVLKPAPVNHGYIFRRTDLEGQPTLEATADNVTDTSRGTTLEKNGVRVATVEHMLASLMGTGVDNVLIDLDGPELPIMDGSARFFTEAIIQAGTTEQEADREYFTVDEVLRFSDPAKKVELLLLPDSGYKVSVMVDYETDVLGTQNAHLPNICDFPAEIANSRTFVFLHELEHLVENGLIKGGDLSNAIVFVNRLVSQDELDRLAKYFNKPKIEVLKEGILNNLDLHYKNEPARHKLLDVVGDLALVGKRIKGHVIASRPGHYSNTQFARKIRQHMKTEGQDIFPQYDPNKEPLYDINAIKEKLPHRPPFLLVDKIMEVTDTYVIGVKNVTMNEPFFAGHFPDEPVMPGVLIIEAMAQTGGMLVLDKVPDPHNYATYFLKIDNVRFRNKVVPGDTLVFKVEEITPFRRGISQMRGVAYVGNKIVTEAELMAQIVKKPV